MKVIFLDIDGVLNYKTSENYDGIDEVCFSNLKSIIDKTNAKIVLISSWRVLWNEKFLSGLSEESRVKVLQEKEKFNKYFVDDMSIFDIVSDKDGARNLEIKEYLRNHKDIDKFVIIDDFDVFYSTDYPNNWVRTSYYEDGLNNELSNMALSILL